MDVDIDLVIVMKKCYDGYYHIVFAYPEALISSKYGQKTYQENVVAIIIDEAQSC